MKKKKQTMDEEVQSPARTKIVLLEVEFKQIQTKLFNNLFSAVFPVKNYVHMQLFSNVEKTENVLLFSVL